MREPGLTGRDYSTAEGAQQTDDGSGTRLAPKFRLADMAGSAGWSVNVALFLLTVITTTVFGYGLAQSFSAGRAFDLEWIFAGYARLTHHDLAVWSGLHFSVPLLVILLAHEFGHYFECRKWRVDATLPYFLPSPTLFGTLGAFIRMRSPIYSRSGLFDIGVSGPLAGFAVLLPFLVSGVFMSRVIHAPHPGTLSIGTPLLMRFVEWVRFPGVPPERIALHPVAVAAWGGLLATAINLLPLGQLDGGHILYAVFGQRFHRFVSGAFVAVLVVLGFFYWAWWIWAVVMFFFGRRHPLVYDDTPLSGGRLVLGATALIVLILSFAVVPVRVT